MATRRCPFCAEQIQATAAVCRFCGRDVPKAAASNSGNAGIGCLAILVLAGGVWGIGEITGSNERQRQDQAAASAAEEAAVRAAIPVVQAYRPPLGDSSIVDSVSIWVVAQELRGYAITPRGWWGFTMTDSVIITWSYTLNGEDKSADWKYFKSSGDVVPDNAEAREIDPR